MLSPAYRLTIGEQRVDTTSEPQASTLVDLDLRLDMTTAADRVELHLGQVGSFRPEIDDEAVVELGYADGDEGLVQVMKGRVDAVDATLEQVRVTAYGSATVLLRSFLEETFLDMSAGEIVSELADRAGVSRGAVEQGIEFPAYVIDGHRSFYHHMAELAALCGFDLYHDSDDELVFEAFGNGNTVHPLRYAAHILELEADRSTRVFPRVEAWGEGPGASAGADSWSWLTKDFEPRRGAAGTGEPISLLERSALRTAEAAQTAADAGHSRFTRRSLRGRLTALGNPAVKLGDAIRLEGLPDGELNGTYQVRSVRHRLNKAAGSSPRSASSRSLRGDSRGRCTTSSIPSRPSSARRCGRRVSSRSAWSKTCSRTAARATATTTAATCA
jgi:hypothetical protein